jgi:hypothetical protein
VPQGAVAIRLIAESCAGFDDVAGSSPFCGNVEWLVNRSITLGCATGLYCPTVPVVRLAMAAFLNREGTALTPQVLLREAVPGALDLDAAPVACQTADAIIGAFPRHAQVDGVFSGTASGTVTIGVAPVASFDGGASWIPLVTNAPLATVQGTHWANVRSVAGRDLAVGQTVRFGLRVDRGGTTGSFDLVDSRCTLRAMIHNRNGTVSPLGLPN